MKKNYSRSFETSPLFSFSNSALESNKTELIDLELDNTAVKKYLPLNNINIQNSSDNKIEVYINQESPILIDPIFQKKEPKRKKKVKLGE
jgi:hypothetical protein